MEATSRGNVCNEYLARSKITIRNCKDEDDIGEHDDIWDDTALIKAYDAAVNAVKDKIAHRLGFHDNDSSPKSGSKKTAKRNSSCKNKKMEWYVGAACRATYSDDGKIYEATIKSIKSDTNSCIVRYVGYGNEEEVLLSQLMVSEGPEARALQEEDALCDASEGDLDNNFHKSHEAHVSKQTVGKEKIPKDSNAQSRGREHLTSFGSQFPPQPSNLSGPSFPSSHMGPSFPFPSSLPPPPPLNVTSGLPVGETEALSAMLMSWYMSGFHTGYFQGLQQAKRLRDASKQSP